MRSSAHLARPDSLQLGATRLVLTTRCPQCASGSLLVCTLWLCVPSGALDPRTGSEATTQWWSLPPEGVKPCPVSSGLAGASWGLCPPTPLLARASALRASAAALPRPGHLALPTPASGGCLSRPLRVAWAGLRECEGAHGPRPALPKERGTGPPCPWQSGPGVHKSS